MCKIFHYLHLLTEGKGPLTPSIADRTGKKKKKNCVSPRININRSHTETYSQDRRGCSKPEIAGVSMPSPISIHMPKMAMKSNTLLATILFSKNFPSALWFLVPLCTIDSECFREMIPIFMFLQSSEYRAKVPPAIIQCMQASIEIHATGELGKVHAFTLKC